MDASHRPRLARLVAELDDDDTFVSEEAQYALIHEFARDALEPLLAAAPSFGDSGRLCAIEVFDAVGDRRAAAVLVPWLLSDNDVVRGWSAAALGRLGATEAVEPLRAAWEASKCSIRPDESEAAALREALRALGARSVVLPLEIDALRIEGGEIWSDRPVWPPEALPAVLAGLASADQVVLSFSYWRGPPPYHRLSGEWIDLDWTKPWSFLVAEALSQGLDTAGSNRPEQAVVHIDWIDRSDVRLPDDPSGVRPAGLVDRT